MQNFVKFVKKYFKINMIKYNKYCKVKDHSHYPGEYRGTAHSICNLNCSVSREISTVFLSGSNYDYHFITKELVEEFEEQFTSLGEYTEKFISFAVAIKEN